jgi:uncharacterized protein
MPTEFTPIEALIGGALIGISSALLLALYGKIAGISSLVESVVAPIDEGTKWKLTFIAGMLTAGILVQWLEPGLLKGQLTIPTWLIVVSGLLVGFGTRLGNGCTSGHGVCGMSRFSLRSTVATLTFMGVAVIFANVMSFFF